MINIITPCSRPENLDKLYNSIKEFGDKEKIWWYIVYDFEQGERKFKYIPWAREFWFNEESCVGYPQRNYALDLIEDDWCYFLDDDNILHPDLIGEIENIVDGRIEGILFRQELSSNDIRLIDPRQCHMDIAQFALRKKLIGDKRFEIGYTADGKFIQEIYNDNHDKILRIEEPLCYYNYLR